MKQLVIGLALASAACNRVVELTDADGDGFPSNIDCNDDDATIHPTADEFCDGIDQDCNGVPDEDYAIDAFTFWRDGDADGFGALGPSITTCTPPDTYVRNADDCDDTDAAINPDADELCDDVDHNCDDDPTAGAVDAEVYYIDFDGDGFVGTERGPACALPDGAGWRSEDCGDTDPLVYPEAPELCDLVDHDCDGALGFDAVVSVDADTVAEAVEQVPDGGVVCVPAGEWEAGVTLASKQVSVVGAGRAQTSLTGTGRRFSVASGGDLTVQDLSLGDLRSENGLTVTEGALTLRGVVFDSVLVHTGDAEATGPLMSVESGSLTLDDVEIADVDVLRTSRVSGLLIAGQDSDVVVSELFVHDVRASTQVYGLLWLDGGSLRGTNVVAQTAYLGRSDSLSDGGLVSANNGATVDLDGVYVRDFDVQWPQGGLFSARDGSTLTLDHVDVERLETVAGTGGLLFTWASGDVLIEHLRLAGSTASVTQGWVHPTNESTAVTLRNVASAGNFLRDSTRGGWIDCDNCTGTQILVENGTFFDGDTSGDGTFATLEAPHLELVNSFLGPAFDTGPNGVLSAFGCDDGPTPCGASLDHVMLGFSGSKLLGFWGINASYEAIALTDEVWAAPGFVTVVGDDPTAWDLHLTSTSPLVDAGTEALKDADGSRSDIGAYGGPGGDDW